MGPGLASTDDLALAHELADIADRITLERFRAGDLQVDTKPDLTPVSEADTAAEQALRQRLAQERPGDAVVGEEFGADAPGHSDRRWIIDPIDGTMNYVRGIPVWATLIALQVGDELEVGLTSAPALHRRWWAVRGEGAFSTDGLGRAPRRLAVSAVRDLEDAQLCLSAIQEWPQASRVLALSERCWRTRGFGDFWGYMLVAEGAAEMATDPEASLWDLAAMQVIVEEAGGRFSDLSGARTPDGGDGLASNGLLHEAALGFLGR